LAVVSEHDLELGGSVGFSGDLDVAVGTELWAIWGYIANRHAELAREGRARFKAAFEAGDDYDQNDELMPAMIAISAAAVSLDGFGVVVRKTGVEFQKPTGKTSRADWVWAVLKAGFDLTAYEDEWPEAITEAFDYRDSTVGGLLHPKTIFSIAQDHPVMPNVSLARAVFTTETADRVVGFMRSVYSVCRVSARDDRPEVVDQMRVSGGILAKLSEGPGY
jgi:hypothetical protein